MPHTIDKPAIGPGITCGNDGRPTPGQLEAPAARTTHGMDHMDGTTLVTTAPEAAEVTNTATPTFEDLLSAYQAADAAEDVTLTALDSASEALWAAEKTRALAPAPAVLTVTTKPITMTVEGGQPNLIGGRSYTYRNADDIQREFASRPEQMASMLAAVAELEIAQAALDEETGFAALRSANEAADTAHKKAADARREAYEAIIEFPTTDPAHIAKKRAILREYEEDDLDWVLDNLLGEDPAATIGCQTLPTTNDERVIALGAEWKAGVDAKGHDDFCDKKLRELLTTPTTTMDALRFKAMVASHHSPPGSDTRLLQMDLDEEARWRIMDDLLNYEAGEPTPCPALAMHDALAALDPNSVEFTQAEEDAVRRVSLCEPTSARGAAFALAMGFNELKVLLETDGIKSPAQVQEVADIALDVMTSVAAFLAGETPGWLLDHYFGFDAVRADLARDAELNASWTDPRWEALREAWKPILDDDLSARLIASGRAHGTFDDFVQIIEQASDRKAEAAR